MDTYDGADRTEMDIEDLKAKIAAGRSIEEAAQFLCRSGTIYDVARKAEELGCTLAWNWPQKKKGIAPCRLSPLN